MDERRVRHPVAGAPVRGLENARPQPAQDRPDHRPPPGLPADRGRSGGQAARARDRARGGRFRPRRAVGPAGAARTAHRRPVARARQQHSVAARDPRPDGLQRCAITCRCWRFRRPCCAKARCSAPPPTRRNRQHGARALAQGQRSGASVPGEALALAVGRAHHRQRGRRHALRADHPRQTEGAGRCPVNAALRPSLVRRMAAMLWLAATLAYAITLVSMVAGANYLIERNLDKQARQLLPVFDDLSAQVLLSPESSARNTNQHLRGAYPRHWPGARL